MAIYIDDKELVAAHRAGDTDAFEELVREYRSPLFRHAQKKLNCAAGAEDAVQETLVRAFRALPKFDGEYRLGPWLHRIMANVCIDEANRRRRDGVKIDSFAALPGARLDAPSVEEELGLELGDPLLDAAFESLSEPHREALELRFLEDLEYEQVAELSGVSEQNARARVSRAKNAMRSALRGVAALPLFLVGLLKRGEKAAAAATSTSGAFAASGGSTTLGVTSAATQSATAVLPTLSEATVAVAQVAPSVVPVVAKAAVGIGLAAAVLTPTSDSALHQAVENLASGTAGVVVEQEMPLTSADRLTIVEQTEESSGQATVSEAGFAPIETQTPDEVPKSLGQPSSMGLSNNAESSAATSALVVGQGGSIKTESLIVRESGGDRYSLSGSVALVIAGVRSDAEIGGSSWIRIDSEADMDGQRRIDGLIEIASDSSQLVALRIAGFGREDLGTLELDGLFRATANSVGMAGAGSFSGAMVLAGSPGPAAFTFSP